MFEVIDTQEKLDAIIKDRVERAKKSARTEAEKEAAERYGDYEALKKAAADAKANMAGKDERIKELEESEKQKAKEVTELQTKVTGLELAHTKYRIVTESGLPLELADRLTGETEEELKADAEKLKGYFHGGRVAPLGGYEETPQDSKRSALKSMLDSMKD